MPDDLHDLAARATEAPTWTVEEHGSKRGLAYPGSWWGAGFLAELLSGEDVDRPSTEQVERLLDLVDLAAALPEALRQLDAMQDGGTFRYLCTSGHHVTSSKAQLVGGECPVPFSDGTTCGRTLQRYTWPGSDGWESVEELKAELAEALRRIEDLESQLDVATETLARFADDSLTADEFRALMDADEDHEWQPSHREAEALRQRDEALAALRELLAAVEGATEPSSRENVELVEQWVPTAAIERAYAALSASREQGAEG